MNENLEGNRDKTSSVRFSETRENNISMKQGKINVQFVKKKKKGLHRLFFKTHDCKNDNVSGKLENKSEFPRKLKIKKWKLKEYM